MSLRNRSVAASLAPDLFVPPTQAEPCMRPLGYGQGENQSVDNGTRLGKSGVNR